MNPEEMKELKELIEFLKESKIGEFDLERGDLKVRIKFAQEGGADMATLARVLAAQANPQPAIGTAAGLPMMSAVHGAVQPSPAAQGAAAPSAEASGGAAEEASLHIVKSPIVGTFYESP